MSRPRIYTPEGIRERRRLRSIEYRKRNREKIRAYKKRPEVRERRKAENRRWPSEAWPISIPLTTAIMLLLFIAELAARLSGGGK